ncbi:MAG: hypothetical protein IPO19_14800 [Rhodoferax sp.]|nr:hypothetical protein [Rhodoferax sp.]
MKFAILGTGIVGQTIGSKLIHSAPGQNGRSRAVNTKAQGRFPASNYWRPEPSKTQPALARSSSTPPPVACPSEALQAATATQALAGRC